MYWLLRVWLVCILAGMVLAQHRLDQDSILAGQGRPRVRERGQAEMGKQDEPTCEELKAIWRFSKRQARAPEIMNEVNSYRDPMMYNEWPAYSRVPLAAPRFQSQYNNQGRETFGRVVTKAPPNVVRTPDYDAYGILNVPHTSGKILRYPGPSRSRSGAPVYSVPPTRHRFEDVRKMVAGEHIRELQRKYEAEEKHELKDLVASGKSIDDYAYGHFNDHEPRGLQHLGPEYIPDEPAPRYPKKPMGGSRQVSQFSRYSDAMIPPARRSFYPPASEYPADYHYGSNA